jgi:hypothetical protein
VSRVRLPGQICPSPVVLGQRSVQRNAVTCADSLHWQRGCVAPSALRVLRPAATGLDGKESRGLSSLSTDTSCPLTSNPVVLPSNRVVPHPACPEPRNERGPTASRRSSGQLSHSTARPAAHQPPRVHMHVMHRLVACSCAFPSVAMAGLLSLIRPQSPGDGSRIQPHFGGRTSSSVM